MNKFDRYFKSNKLNIDKKLINRYGVYKSDKYNNYYGQVFEGRDFTLITNSYSIIATNCINADFTRFDDNMNNTLVKFFNDFNDRNIWQYTDTIGYDTIKNNVKDDNYKINDSYGIGYMQLKKIIDIIGYVKINILEKQVYKNEYQPVIEIIGKNGCVGYLLPTRIY